MDFCQVILFSTFWIITPGNPQLAGWTDKTSIPSHLLDCYRDPRPPLLPMTVNTFIEIIRKINFNSYTPVSAAQEAADILNWFCIDGLERDPNVISRQLDVVPYHRTGFQAYKQDLLFEKLIPTRRRTFDAHSLSLIEKCTLHFMLSASVDPWERGDEIKICPNSYQDFRSSTSQQDRARFSSCPLELGAVLTSAGSVSVGHVLAGIIAALLPQQVSLQELMSPQQLWAAQIQPAVTDSISNVWAATLAGDLAEVAVLQAPQYDTDVSIGISAKWNDTYIPSRLYFSNVPYSIIEKRSWEITDAEILGGIDGLLLGGIVLKWKRQMPEMRLSQLLEMYYLDTRISEDTTNVCTRAFTFDSYIRDNKQTLVEQTQNFAALLTTKTTGYYTDSTLIPYRCGKTVEKFMQYYPNLFGVEKCPSQVSFIPRINLIMIIDATWPPYTTLQFLVQVLTIYINLKGLFHSVPITGFVYIILFMVWM